MKNEFNALSIPFDGKPSNQKENIETIIVDVPTREKRNRPTNKRYDSAARPIRKARNDYSSKSSVKRSKEDRVTFDSAGHAYEPFPTTLRRDTAWVIKMEAASRGVKPFVLVQAALEAYVKKNHLYEVYADRMPSFENKPNSKR